LNIGSSQSASVTIRVPLDQTGRSLAARLCRDGKLDLQFTHPLSSRAEPYHEMAIVENRF